MPALWSLSSPEVPEAPLLEDERFDPPAALPDSDFPFSADFDDFLLPPEAAPPPDDIVLLAYDTVRMALISILKLPSLRPSDQLGFERARES